MEGVVSKDDLLKKRLMDDLSEPCLRNPKKFGDVGSFERIKLGEERVGQTREEQPKRKERPMH
eukprot:10479537-Prorocentrum_lima.AAC.1